MNTPLKPTASHSNRKWIACLLILLMPGGFILLPAVYLMRLLMSGKSAVAMRAGSIVRMRQQA